MDAKPTLSIVIPAKNEARGLATFLPELRTEFPDAEVLVVDDGSSDETGTVAEQAGARVVRHRRSLGNGAAIKTGVRNATGDLVLFMDGDGQHTPADARALVDEFGPDVDMLVGARDRHGQASVGRLLANVIYNRIAGYIANQTVLDLTSGLRMARREQFLQFLYLLPNGFSYPTTITLAYFRTGYVVDYVPIQVQRREGKSHISPLKDGLRFLTILFKLVTLYSPLKLFAPLSALFVTTGCGYYLFTYLTAGRFTNMSLLLLVTGTLIFLIGLVAEQITTLIYRPE